MSEQDPAHYQNIQENLNCMYAHLTNILGEAGIIMAKIDEMKR